MIGVSPMHKSFADKCTGAQVDLYAKINLEIVFLINAFSNPDPRKRIFFSKVCRPTYINLGKYYYYESLSPL